MRVRTALAFTFSVTAFARVALALAPCPPSCHLGQGKPLFLPDAGVVLVTRCDRVAGKTGRASTCATERLDLDGKLLERLPRVPYRTGPDQEFTESQLAGKALIQLGWQTPWPTLTRPYVLNELFTHQQLTLSLKNSTLSCAAKGLPAVTREFGCVPKAIHVFATTSSDKPQRRPVVVIGVCQPDATTQHEVAVVCSATER